jgi:hypothetical protein
MHPLIAPVVNLNGTSRDALREQYVDVMEGMDAAIKTLIAAMPNGRDYQTVDSDGSACAAARQAFYDRLDLLSHMRAEFETVALAIVEGETQ